MKIFIGIRLSKAKAVSVAKYTGERKFVSNRIN